MRTGKTTKMYSWNPQDRPRTRGVLLPCCAICQQVPETGIRGGVKVENIFICQKCEWDIVSSEAGSPEYENLLNQVKKIISRLSKNLLL